MQFEDKITLDGKTRLTKDGYLVANARFARTGIQDYQGYELGRPELGIVKVYRPESEVFNADAMRSFGGKPITVDHPSGGVSSENYKDVNVGRIDENIVRDGDYVRAPMILMDAEAIKTVQSGKNELSAGYTAELVWGDGETPDGKPYHAKQTNISGNHVSIVSRGRGGNKLKIGDKHKPKGDSAMTDFTKMVLDGITVNVPVSDAANVKALFDAKDEKIAGATASLTDAQTKLADAETQIETLKGEKAVLETQVADAAITPEKLTALVAERTVLVADAARILGDAKALETMDATAIKKAVVTHVLGDAAADMSDDAIAGAYAMASKSAPKTDPVRGVIMDGVLTPTNDASDARAQMLQERSNAYKGGAK